MKKERKKKKKSSAELFSGEAVKPNSAVKDDQAFVREIERLSAGLFYISETDAEIRPFAGDAAEAVTKDEILRQTGCAADTPVEERNFAELFARLTAMQDWFSDEEKAAAEKFARLKDYLEKNLKDLKVFKVGSIQLDLYVVGLDEKGKLAGIQTKAVET